MHCFLSACYTRLVNRHFAAKITLPLILAAIFSASFWPPYHSAHAEGTADLPTPHIAIRTINPGYTIDDIKNTGELIELINLTSINPDYDPSIPGAEKYQEPNTLDLDNLALIYTAKSSSASTPGKSTIIYMFPSGSQFVGRSILLRYESSPEATADSTAQDLTYTTSLAQAGALSLIKLSATADLSVFPTTSSLDAFGEVISSVCWLGGESCLPTFSTTVKSRAYTTITRDDFTGEYTHTNSAELLYNPSAPGLYLPPDIIDSPSDLSNDTNPPNALAASKCYGLEFSEILSYYDTDSTEQFIELYNSTDAPLSLDGCKIRYKNKSYPLASATIQPSGFYVLSPPPFRFTKNPTAENTLELVDANGAIIDTLTYPHGQKKSTTYALIGYHADGSENWQVTYAATPGAANIFQEYQSCPAGKIINEATGNCVKADTLKTTSTLKDCGAGKYRNPLTGRCKSYNTDSEQASCKDGYERNPETGRCRKIRENTGADYPVVPLTSYEEKTTFIALWALGGVALLGVGIITFQFRQEITYFVKKIAKKRKK